MTGPEDQPGIPSDDEVDKLADELDLRRLLHEAAEHFDPDEEAIFQRVKEGIEKERELREAKDRRPSRRRRQRGADN